MRLVFALGNPGRRYARTRHNVGWRVAEILVARWKAAADGSTETWRAWRAEVVGNECRVAIPLAYMNRSGESLMEMRMVHPFEPEELMVLSDDVYLPVGVLRLRSRGSDGGHRGLESIERALGTRDYARLRIGVGAAESERLRDHVLEDFDEDEERRIGEAVASAADAVETWVREGLVAAMNRYNQKTTQEGSPS